MTSPQITFQIGDEVVPINDIYPRRAGVSVDIGDVTGSQFSIAFGLRGHDEFWEAYFDGFQ